LQVSGPLNSDQVYDLVYRIDDEQQGAGDVGARAEQGAGGKGDKQGDKQGKRGGGGAAGDVGNASDDLKKQIAADRQYARDLVKLNRDAAQLLRAILTNQKRRDAFMDALVGALKNSAPKDADGSATSGNDTDATESAETRKAHFKAEEGDEVEAEEEDDKPRRRGKVKEVETTLEHAVHDAFTDLADLGGECRDVVENAPPGLDQSQRISTLDETASELENLQEPEVPAELAELPVKYLPGRVRSRVDRCYAATEIIQACVDALATIPEGDERHAAASNLSSELDDAITVRDNCVFPGMYG
jgi:hypothetical protein